MVTKTRTFDKVGGGGVWGGGAGYDLRVVKGYGMGLERKTLRTEGRVQL